MSQDLNKLVPLVRLFFEWNVLKSDLKYNSHMHLKAREWLAFQTSQALIVCSQLFYPKLFC